MNAAPAPDGNTGLARTLVDEWVRAGVSLACLAPGSRSTPLVLALADHPDVRVEMFVDERSAAFFALGAARANGRPALVVCTSGTAGAHFHPAVLEAHHGRVPMLVCTADRPVELRDTGAPQTIDQPGLFGGAVRWAFELGAGDVRPAAVARWRSVAARAVVEATGPPAGPVHLNLAFPEPLMPTGDPVPEPPGRDGGRPWIEVSRAPSPAPAATVERLAERVAATERGLVVAGWGAGVELAAVERFARSARWPVLADPLSGLRAGANAVTTYEALLRAPGFAAAHRPDVVVRLGAPPTSRRLSEWMDPDVEQVAVEAAPSWLDPLSTVAERVIADPALALAAVEERLPGREHGPWIETWLDAERRARGAIDRVLDEGAGATEARAARDLVVGLPSGATLVVGSSMPVRDVEAFAPPRADVRIVANRGVNGIDGFASTALGVASCSAGPVVALCGDLTFIHDANGLVGAGERGPGAVFVVIDNDGGGIFSFLPQAAALTRDRFEALFGTPPGVDVRALAAAHGIETTDVDAAADLVPAVEKALALGGVGFVRVRTDREANVADHRRIWEAVADAL